MALTVSGLGVHVEDVAHLQVSGHLALASVTEAGGTSARYTAFKMGDVTVSGDVNLGIGGLTAEIVVKSLDMNIAPAEPERGWTGRMRSIWMATTSMRDDVLDPGALLPTPARPGDRLRLGSGVPAGRARSAARAATATIRPSAPTRPSRSTT